MIMSWMSVTMTMGNVINDSGNDKNSQNGLKSVTMLTLFGFTVVLYLPFGATKGYERVLIHKLIYRHINDF